MIIIDKFLDFHKKLMSKHDTKRYDSLLLKKPFVEEEDDNSFTIHDLIEEEYLDFISLDIGSNNSCKYTVLLSDKALEEIKKIKQS